MKEKVGGGGEAEGTRCAVRKGYPPLYSYNFHREMFDFPTKITIESFRIFYDTYETHHVFRMMNFNLEWPEVQKNKLVIFGV